MNLDYQRPCDTKEIRDDFSDHEARGSALPGLDYACNTGDAVYATATGRVIQADNNPNQIRGRNIIIQHADGRRSHYLHLYLLLVKVGDHIRAGRRIAKSGNTGTTTTGAHLHFAIQDKKGKCFDPEPFLKKEKVQQKKQKAEAVAVEEVSETS